MSDEAERELERKVAQGDEDALDKLKRAWLRTQVYRECPTCKADVPDGVWEEHQAEHKASLPSGGSRLRTVPIPTGGLIAARPRKNPVYDRIVIPGDSGATQNRFFAGDSKPIWETNLNRGTMPHATHLFWYGVSLIPDARAHPDDVALIYDTGLLRVDFASTRLLELPARIVTDDQPTIETQEGEEQQQRMAWEARSVLHPDPRVTRLRCDGPVRDVTISTKPIEIASMDSVRFSLEVEPGIQRDTGIMLVLFGVLLRGITA